MRVKHFLNFHKGTTFLFVLGLMAVYQNFSVAAWVYLALHGTYGLLWLLKDQIYPDKQWEQEVSWLGGLSVLGFVSLYWIAPFLLISRGVEPPPPLIAGAIALNLLGIFLSYGSDAQKYFTLKYHSGLITEGFFARCRNPNYLGEFLIYLAFAMLTMHWLPYLVLGGITAALFVPNMLKKDKSLSRYPEFAAYKQRSGLILPKLWPELSPEASGEMGQ